MIAPSGWNLSVKAVHTRLIKLKPKTGRCDFCKAEADTDYALIHGRDHQPTAENYLELCRSCHICYDQGEIDLLTLHSYTGRYVP